ncbi:YncE family protein [Duganella callida]|uniref:YncE family protein n=1 Tax=Duganella callida TaxID=2561932 RepID=A0A4Y9SPN6_9BURK|nr:YncE family protein [Duganella callida]TFW25580.1 YncE family protein [Duganella callida]
MKPMNRIVYAALAAAGLTAAVQASAAPANVYAGIAPSNMNPVTKDHLQRVYVPNLRSNDVYVIDPETLKVVDKFKVGVGPQHVVPGWDLQSLWVANNAERTNKGSLTPIDPRTGKPGTQIPVDDPYNMYFSPDGKSAIVVAEALHRLDFRDPHTMQMQYSIDAPECGGINHADFSPDGRYAIFTCEFNGSVARIDLAARKVDGYLKLSMPATRFSEKSPLDDLLASEVCTSKKGMPQDIRVSPDGKRYYIADMEADGVHVIDAASFTKVGFIPTGVGAHGIYPSRDGTKLYVANRGTHRIHGKRKGKGSVTVIDFATEKVVSTWRIPGGGSPDMGNVSADGKYLWLSGRFDDVVYRIDTGSGDVKQIKVGQEPHGLTVWPQPGRYSLGHTGNMR